jgi:hypothetical protein
MLKFDIGVNEDKIKESVLNAANWITDIAIVKDDDISSYNNSKNLEHIYWKGAVKGEYHAGKKQWDFFCPIWHGGQAIKALIKVYKLFNDKKYLESAKLIAEFIKKERIDDVTNPDYGLILAYEDKGNAVNTSAILECVDGLMDLSEITEDMGYFNIVEDALKWVAEKSYIQKEGLFRDSYEVAEGKWISVYGVPDQSCTDRALLEDSVFLSPGRPLLDDGVFLRLFKHTGNLVFKDIFYETAHRLLKDESPDGNWIKYGPCNIKLGRIHPRHAYWWGRPMILAYEDSKDEKFLECAKRAGIWYVKAQRRDGGLFRGTYVDFNTDSFGHCTSGIACATILWAELYRVTNDPSWIPPIEKAIKYCINMQLNNVKDFNLKGAILEKVLPPDGTDSLPYYIRDLATIFFIQAVGMISYRRTIT